MTEETGKVTNYVPEDRAGMTERGLKATLDKVASLGYAGIGVTGLVLLKGTLVAVLLIFAGRGLLYDGLALYKGESHQWRLERKDTRAYDIEVMKLKWEQERTLIKEAQEFLKDEAIKRHLELKKRLEISPNNMKQIIKWMRDDAKTTASDAEIIAATRDKHRADDWIELATVAYKDARMWEDKFNTLKPKIEAVKAKCEEAGIKAKAATPKTWACLGRICSGGRAWTDGIREWGCVRHDGGDYLPPCPGR